MPQKSAIPFDKFAIMAEGNRMHAQIQVPIGTLACGGGHLDHRIHVEMAS
jgi:hypothetical protein